MWRWSLSRDHPSAEDRVPGGEEAAAAGGRPAAQPQSPELPRAADQLAAIVEGSDDAIVSTDLDGTITTWNRGAEQLYGYPASEALGANVAILYPEKSAGLLAEIRLRIAAGERVVLAEEPRRRSDGSIVTVELRISPMRDAAGNVVGTSAIARDVSDRVRREQQLQQSRGFLEQTQAMGHIGSWQTTIGPENLVELTPEGYRVLGIEPGQPIRNIDFFKLLVPEDREVLMERFIRARSEQVPTELEVRIARPDGKTCWLHVVASGVRDEAGQSVGLRGLIQDVTERKDAEERLVHDALHDRLTGLPSRPLLIDRLAHSLERAGRNQTKVAVLCIDLDRFKLFNDTRGRDRGDELLQLVAGRLATSLLANETVAHLGADEFVVTCEDLQSATEVLQRVERLLALFEEPFDLGDEEAAISASIGVALDEPGTSAESLLRDGDLAMSQAKHTGRNRYALYNLAIRQQAERRVTLDAALRLALERDELYLEFQPIVSLEDGHFLAVEALARWRHPERGLIYPEEFIPMAEQSGLIASIGAWILHQSFGTLRRWQDRAPALAGLSMLVNVSPAQLADDRFLAVVGDALAGTGVDGPSIWLELTESVLVQGGATAEVLAAVRSLGPRVCIDDFGTGYSALAYLTRLPVDGLKIDRSFVDGVGEVGADRAVVSAIVALGRALDLRVTAEGVTDASQLKAVRHLGCDAAQGFFLSPPLGAEACFTLLASGRRWPLAPLDGEEAAGRAS